MSSSITPTSKAPFIETDLSQLIRLIQELQEEIKKTRPSIRADDETAGEIGRAVPPSDDKAGGSISARGSSTRKAQVDKLQNGMDQIATRLTLLGMFEQVIKARIEGRVDAIRRLLENIQKADKMDADAVLDASSSSTEEEVKTQLGEMIKEIRKLKHQIPSWPGAAAAATGRAAESRPGATVPEAQQAVDGLLAAESSKGFGNSDLYGEVKLAYEGLNDKEKSALLRLSVFAENEDLKKRMLAYWWAGEGLLQGDIKTAAGEMLDKFERLQLIQPVRRKRWSEAKRYGMEPLVRSAIERIAEEEGRFRFTHDGKFAAAYSGGNKVAAAVVDKVAPSSSPMKMPAAEGSEEGGARKSNWLKKWSHEERLETIFNVNEQFPDLKLKSLAKQNGLPPDEWLLKMKALKVLYLGNWRTSGKHHIEVEGIEFLKGLKNMQKLKLLSLQGISRINELTDSIKWLTNLEILDLKSCHNLEVLPKEISYLKNLTHLDVSNCFLIDHMPKGLSALTKLKVLKGFVVGDYRTGKFCTLESLKVMKNLNKLSVIISKKDFPTKSELSALAALDMLKKLTLSWGADSTRAGTKNGTTNQADNQEEVLPPKLEKLDLQCYPHSKIPSWLSPKTKLQGLYIRGGRLGDGDSGLLISGQKWESIKTLRLKYLAGIKMTWEDMQSSFPNLNYLEKVDCPLITLCPCDEDGVWVNEAEGEKDDHATQ